MNDTNNPPESGEDRTENMGMRVSPAEKQAIEEAAEKAGRSVSEHLRKSAVGVVPEPTVELPEVRFEAYADLSQPANNLNQISRRAHTLWHTVRSQGGIDDDLANHISELFSELQPVVNDLFDQIQQLRRRLVSAEPLVAAASVLEDYAAAASTRKVGCNREKLERLADDIRDVADQLEEATE